MKLLKIMQLSGQMDLGVAIADIERAFIELESEFPEKIAQANTSTVANQRYYSIPPNSLQIKEIRLKYELNGETKYRAIPRIRNVSEVEEDGV
tara:strand:+ start:11631 stop:11909 length:279 start_codon:yes stop_codon:yes gene_type:complete